jgi:ABC-2 type transport system ATP-binding protein
MAAVIEVRELSKRFGTVLALDRLACTVERGRVTGFLGPNGAGKTTTIRMLLGLVKPTAGSATIDGQPYRRLTNRSRCVGALLDAAGLPPGRRARDHLRIRALTGGIGRARIDAVLDMVDLTGAADRRVGEFSLGMRQRLGLAAALLGEPEVLILDEPANGLDPEGVRWLRSLLRGIADDGRSVLVSSHILAEVAQIADDIIILDRGRLVTQSSLADLTAGARPVVRIKTPEVVRLHSVLGGAGAEVRVVDEDRVEVRDLSPEVIAKLAAEHAIPVIESVTEAANLEDLFFQLTAQADPVGTVS